MQEFLSGYCWHISLKVGEGIQRNEFLLVVGDSILYFIDFFLFFRFGSGKGHVLGHNEFKSSPTNDYHGLEGHEYI